LHVFQDKGDRREGILSCLRMLGYVINRRQAQIDRETNYPYELPSKPPRLGVLLTDNHMHQRTGFIQFHRWVMPIGMAQAAL
jgi:hypothetical protein